MTEAATWLLVLLVMVALLAGIGRRSRRPGSAAAGGNLPDLEGPRNRSR